MGSEQGQMWPSGNKMWNMGGDQAQAVTHQVQTESRYDHRRCQQRSEELACWYLLLQLAVGSMSGPGA